jgi:hypothetical protein
MTMRAIIAVAAALASMTPASAGTLTCSTWQNIRTCQDGHGYTSHETEWQGRTYSDDSEGSRWSTSSLAGPHHYDGLAAFGAVTP